MDCTSEPVRDRWEDEIILRKSREIALAVNREEQRLPKRRLAAVGSLLSSAALLHSSRADDMLVQLDKEMHDGEQAQVRRDEGMRTPFCVVLLLYYLRSDDQAATTCISAAHTTTACTFHSVGLGNQAV